MATSTTTSDALLNVGKKFTDPLLVTREKPKRLPPPAALSMVKSFLPQLQKANQDLEAIINSGKNDDLDIEKISQDGDVIEMNLMLFNKENSDDDDDDEEVAACQIFSPSESDSDISLGEITEDNIKLPNQGQRKKPLILEMKPETMDCSGETQVNGGNLRTSQITKAKEGLSPPKKLPSRRGKKQRNVKSNNKKRKGQKK